MHSYKFSTILFFLSVFACSISAASHKSLVNRYAFSDDYLDSLNKVMLSEKPHYFSLPTSITLPNHPFLEFDYKHKKLTSDLYSILSYENNAGEHLPNIFLGSVISYQSPHLRGEIQFDAHTTYMHTPENLADSLNDVRFEQHRTTYDHISGTGNNKDFNFQHGYLEFSLDNISLLSGKYPLRWGPGYKGTLGLSGTSYNPLYYYLLQADIAQTVHASAFLSSFDDSYLFVGDTAPNADRFCAGQRLDVKIGKHVQLGFYEFVNFNGTALLSRYANPIQLYYISNHLSNDLVIEKRNNIMGGLDFNILAGPLRFYGDFLNDDITVFDDNGSPNKFGFQAGGAYYGNSYLQEIGVEYTHVSRWTYGHWAPGLNRFTYFKESRGWPWGNDMDLWHLHARFNLPKNIRFHTEINWWIKGEGTLTEYHGDIPGSIRPDLDNVGGMVDYGNDSHLVSFQVGASWRPMHWIDCEVLWLPVVVKGTMENRIRVMTILWLPTVYKREL